MRVTQRTPVPRNTLGFEKNVSPIQRQLLEDTSRKILCCAGRRAGKTFAVLVKALKIVLGKQDAFCWAILPTRERAKLIYWPALKKINEQYRLGARLNESELSAVFPTGSTIRLTGVDDLHDANKFRGTPADLYAIDEAASYRDNVLRDLIEDAIVPAAEDFLDAQILICGTPGNCRSGYFHDADRRNNPSSAWSSYHWTVQDNNFFERWRGKPDWQERAAKFLDEMRAERGWLESSPVFRREWLALWDSDDSSFYYNEFQLDRNTISATDIPAPLSYVFGLDLGTRIDPSAIVVLGYNEHLSKTTYVVDAIKIESGKGQNTTERICNQIKRLSDEYQPDVIMGDYAAGGSYIFDLMASHHNVYIQDAKKNKKSGTTDIINDRFHAGLIKVNKELPELITELQTIRWDSNRKGPDPSWPNDLTDAMSYGYTEVYSYLWKPEKPKPTYQELVNAEIEEHFRRYDEQMEEEAQFWDVMGTKL